MAAQTNTLQTYSFLIDKYSSCSAPIQTRTQSSDLHWDHFSHRDQLSFKIQCQTASSYAYLPICKIIVLWQEHILEEVDVIALATRNIPNYLPEQKCISFLGRYPAISAKYYNEPTQTLRRFQIRLTKETDYLNVSNLLESFKCPVRPGSVAKPHSQNRSNPKSSSSIPSSPSSLFPQNEPIPEPGHTRSASTPSSMVGSSIGGDSRPQTSESSSEILRSDTETFGMGALPPKPTENFWGRGIPLDVSRSSTAMGAASLSLDTLPPLKKPTPARKAAVAKEIAESGRNTPQKNNTPSTSFGKSPSVSLPPFTTTNSQSNDRTENMHGTLREPPSPLYEPARNAQSPLFQQIFRQEQSEVNVIQRQSIPEPQHTWSWMSAPPYHPRIPPQRQFSELPSLSHYGLSPEEVCHQKMQEQAQAIRTSDYCRIPAHIPQSEPSSTPATHSPSSPVLAKQAETPARVTAKGKCSKKETTAKKKTQKDYGVENALFNMRMADMTDENIDDLIVECIHNPEFADFLGRVEKNWRRVGIEAVQTFR